MFPRNPSPWREDALVLVLAGGVGKRLYPLTQAQTKGAVPFAGRYRLIDFTLSNCLHSDLPRIAILAQYKFASLERHLRLGWDIFQSERGGCLEIALPPRTRNGGYQGTADPEWPVHTFHPGLPAAQIRLENEFNSRVTDALLCPGVQVIDAQVESSILGPGVTVDPRAEVCESVLMEGVHVGSGAWIHRAIVDQGMRIPANYSIGGAPFGRESDFHVSPGGITVVPQGAALAPDRETRAAYAYFG